MAKALNAFLKKSASSALEKSSKKEKPISAHKFWKTQPVLKDDTPISLEDLGPIETKTLKEISTTPYKLPKGLVWAPMELAKPSSMNELYDLLTKNYVEDDDCVFRFDYSRQFLHWALHPPGFKTEWHIGVRAQSNNELVGFISAVPSTLRSYTATFPGVEINFLCVNKRLRNKRLAPLLIQEVTRRVNLHDIWQAAYTSGNRLPTPVGACRYFHRSLNPKKLSEIQFSYKPASMSMAAYTRKYKLPADFTVEGFRPMTAADVPRALELFNAHQAATSFTQVFNEEELAHWLLPRKDVVTSYVREVEGTVTDFFSYYYLPSSVTPRDLNQHPHRLLRAVYSFYNVATSISMESLIEQALISAKKYSHDVYNALELMDNGPVFQPLNFAAGDGVLNYYIYNWKSPTMKASDVGLVLL